MRSAARSTTDLARTGAEDRGVVGLEGRGLPTAATASGRPPIPAFCSARRSPPVHRLQRHAVRALQLDPNERGELAVAGARVDLPEQLLALDVHGGVSASGCRGSWRRGSCRLAPRVPGRRRLKSGDLVAEPDRAGVGAVLAGDLARLGVTDAVLFISNRSAKSDPQASRTSRRTILRPELTTATCSSMPLPTNRNRRTATVFVRRPGSSGLAR